MIRKNGRALAESGALPQWRTFPYTDRIWSKKVR
jgi:hypothetical protein